jgi:tetratricopeptide (TPR) repeat protein
MAKYTSEDIRKIAERLKGARDRDRPAHFLMGAGCSISAGIPSAADLIARIHKDYPAHCADLSSDNRDSYGACMALLSLNERRDLIKPYLESARINWGTIALAQLIVNGFIGRVLTANFDLVLENACGLLGLQPAVYDFGVAPANDPEMIVSPSIIHLHGQSYGLVLLNTDEETKKHREKLRPILTDSLRNAPLVVVGYSGSADGIFQTLFDEFEGRERLYWASYEEEPKPHIRPFLEKDHFQFVGGAEFDRFMIELARSLGCWPPNLFSNPLGHLLEELRPVVSYPVMDSDSAIDLLDDLRGKLKSWQHNLDEGALRSLYMKGEFGEVVRRFSSRKDQHAASKEDREIASSSLVMLGNSLFEQAKLSRGSDAARLMAEATDKYRGALAIEPDRYEALLNLGNQFLWRARLTAGDEAAQLFTQGAEMYQQALAINPNLASALYNWGSLLIQQAKRANVDDAVQLFAEAERKLAAALKINPTRTYNIACLAALQGDEHKCRENLEHAEQHGTLPNIEYLASDPDLETIRNKSWFQDFLARQKNVKATPKRTKKK